ncbi:MAG: CBS domain-containing protein, partial [Clostridiales bacterium]|nr:CBS domain-containing protein [Clostridiales bacterium]
ASEIMIHRTDIESVWVNESEEEILSIISRTGMSRFPVYDEDIDDIIGILFTRDYLMNLHSESPKPLREMVRSAYFVPETVHTDELFRDMQKNKTHMAIIVDEYGGTSGLVTLEDLLEEIVGNIYDEFDQQTEQEIVEEGNGRWRVAGGVELETLASVLDIEIPTDEEFDTLGGLVYSRLTSIPEDGSRPRVEAFGLSIQVEELVDRRVEWATVEKLPPVENDDESEQSERSSRKEKR